MPHFRVVAIPLNRPPVVAFLKASVSPDASAPRRGAPLRIIDQRPTRAALAAWAGRLHRAPTVETLIQRDDPHAHLIQTTTDRLIPVAFLRDDPDYLTRNLGGWGAVYFAVIDAPTDPPPDDPLLAQAETLADYGPRIRTYGADPAQVGARLLTEFGLTAAALSAAFIRLDTLRQQRIPPQSAAWREIAAWAMRVYAEIATERCFADADAAPLPEPLLLDELLDALVRIEQTRRAAFAAGDDARAEAIRAWQAQRQQQHGLLLILKGEYIMGRHRRSTVLIAPELGSVAKQPAPEPFHEAHLGFRTVDGQPENWPVLTRDGALVTPGGRVRQVVDEHIIAPLNRVFAHPVRLYTLLGLVVEPFVAGPTVQEYVLQQPARLQARVYEQVLIHQRVCELLGIENGDWHSANFIVLPQHERDGTPRLVHIDWGAARPLRNEEHTPDAAQARLAQVRNFAFSFHDEALAAQAARLHDELVADADRLAAVTEKARHRIRAAGLTPRI